jgi:hypothetical protein
MLVTECADFLLFVGKFVETALIKAISISPAYFIEGHGNSLSLRTEGEDGTFS